MTASPPGVELLRCVGVQNLEQRQQSKSERTAQGRDFWTRFRRTIVFTVSAFMELVLWRAGYPIWRLATIGVLFAALIGLSDLVDSGVIEGAATRAAGVGHREQSPT